MKYRRPDPLEPETYLSDMSQPDWRFEELRYVAKHTWDHWKPSKKYRFKRKCVDDNLTTQNFLLAVIKSAGFRLTPLATDNKEINILSHDMGGVILGEGLSPLFYLVRQAQETENAASREEDYLNRLLREIKFISGEGWQLPSQVENLVIGAVRQLGMNSICAFRDDQHLEYEAVSRRNVLKRLPLLTKLGIFVSAVIHSWQLQVIYGDDNTRRLARAHLQQIGRALIPDTRGKSKTAPPIFRLDVKTYYWETLFRLYQLRNALLVSPGTTRTKTIAASKNFGLSLEDIQEFFGLDSAYQIKRGSGPYSIKDMARVLTARRFGVTQHTISNVLSS